MSFGREKRRERERERVPDQEATVRIKEKRKEKKRRRKKSNSGLPAEGRMQRLCGHPQLRGKEEGRGGQHRGVFWRRWGRGRGRGGGADEGEA